MSKLKRLICIFMAFCLLLGTASALTLEDFRDVEGHWAVPYLDRAVADGILEGDAGLLRPDGALSGAEMAAILTRILKAETQADLSAVGGLAETDWYYDEAGRAVYLGILAPEDGTLALTGTLPREAVFSAMAAAFQLIPARPDHSVLDRFSDAADLSAEHRDAAAALVARGIVEGDRGKLFPQRGISRSEFVTILYRIVAGFPKAADLSGTVAEPVLLTEQALTLQNLRFDGTLVLGAPVERATLRSVKAGELLVRSEQLFSLQLSSGTELGRLTLAAAKGDLNLSIPSTASVDCLALGFGSGRVSLSGSVRTLEVLGDGRSISLPNLKLDRLLIRGSGNSLNLVGSSVGEVILLDGASGNSLRSDGSLGAVTVLGADNELKLNRIGSLELAGTHNAVTLSSSTGDLRVAGDGAHLTVNGTVPTVTVGGSAALVEGRGLAAQIIPAATDCSITLNSRSPIPAIDPGLDGFALTLTAPAVEPGGSLKVSAAVTGPAEVTRLCSLRWTRDGAEVEGAGQTDFSLVNGAALSLELPLTFTFDMAESVLMGLELSYVNTTTGQTELLTAEQTVAIENYPPVHYQTAEGVTLLSKIGDHYHGNYTKEYNVDYPIEMKEAFVNDGGYSSQTPWLVWISLESQKVNVFEGKAGEWELQHCFRCATGKRSTPTPQGVTHTTYKQPGWYTEEYTCKPVVRFYPGTGYAFHSRLYYPQGSGKTDKLKDSRIGFPVSEGCIRMYDEDILWLYDNLPEKSTVVIW